MADVCRYFRRKGINIQESLSVGESPALAPTTPSDISYFTPREVPDCLDEQSALVDRGANQHHIAEDVYERSNIDIDAMHILQLDRMQPKFKDMFALDGDWWIEFSRSWCRDSDIQQTSSSSNALQDLEWVLSHTNTFLEVKPLFSRCNEVDSCNPDPSDEIIQPARWLNLFFEASVLLVTQDDVGVSKILKLYETACDLLATQQPLFLAITFMLFITTETPAHAAISRHFCLLLERAANVLFGPEHPLAKIWRALRTSGRKVELALRGLRRMLEISQDAVGHLHPDSLTILSWLADAAFMGEAYAEACVCYDQLLGVREGIHGRNSPAACRTLLNIAHCLLGMDQDAKAKALLKDVWTRSPQLGHEDRAEVITRAARRMAEIEFRRGRYTSGVILLERAARESLVAFGKEHAWSVTAQRDLDAATRQKHTVPAGFVAADRNGESDSDAYYDLEADDVA